MTFCQLPITPGKVYSSNKDGGETVAFNYKGNDILGSSKNVKKLNFGPKLDQRAKMVPKRPNFASKIPRRRIFLPISDDLSNQT